ncbi:MAG: hypothetical protein LW808_003215 [Verrucomicrobiota bacterium]|nr:MAG: hypothetical protein LW808_003215 [Verrucomicrobiota bacterium]
MKIIWGEWELARGAAYGEVPQDLKISGQRSVQLLTTVRGETSKALNRGNLLMNLEFRVRKKHPTAEIAQEDALRHASELKTETANLMLVGESGKTTFQLKDAVIANIISSSNGNIAEHFYKIVGGRVCTTESANSSF